MNFWAGMAIGVLISFVISLLLDKPETVINGKNKVKARGNAIVDNQFKPNNSTGKIRDWKKKRQNKGLFKRKNK